MKPAEIYERVLENGVPMDIGLGEQVNKRDGKVEPGLYDRSYTILIKPILIYYLNLTLTGCLIDTEDLNNDSARSTRSRLQNVETSLRHVKPSQ